MHLQDPNSNAEVAAAVAKIIARLEGRPADHFKLALIHAVQALEEVRKPSIIESLTLLDCCISCHDRNDDDAARLLMFISGAISDTAITLAVLYAIGKLAQQVEGALGSN